MSNAVLAAIVVPIVVALALAVWITMVYHADRHPGSDASRRGSEPRREVTGGSFRGTGGRQVMPLPGQPPASGDAEEVPGAATSIYDAARGNGHRNAGRATTLADGAPGGWIQPVPSGHPGLSVLGDGSPVSGSTPA